MDDVVHPSYKAAALTLGLLENDDENDKCLREATLFQMPRQLRQLFAILLAYCDPADPSALWVTYLDALAEDYAREVYSDDPATQLRRVTLRALLDVENALILNGKSLSNYESLPQIYEFEDLLEDVEIQSRRGNRLIENE